MQIQANERLDDVNYQIKLIQKVDGMTFGTDALLLASFIKPNPKGTAIEFGTGSGIISLFCATRNKFAHITAVEFQEEYAELSRRNITLNQMQEQITICHADVRDTKAYLPQGDAHVVFSNPPYMTVDSGYESKDLGRQAARHEVYGTIFDFCHAASKKLRYGGSFYVVWRPDRMSDLFAALRENKLEPKRMTMVCQSPKHAPSMLLLEARLGGKPGLIATPIFYLQDDNGMNNPKFEQLLLDGTFPF